MENKIKIKISVIIPIYNTEKYLEKCIDSVLNQTLKEIEIILINDGSPDKSDEICKKYLMNEDRIKYIEIKNSGVSAARNCGLNIVRGEYISFIDSDDFVEKEMLEGMYTVAKEKDLDILGCEANYIDKNNNKTRVKDLKGYIDRDLSFFEFVDEYEMFGYSCFKIFKAEIIKENKIKFLENCKIFEDAEFVFEAAVYSKKIQYIDKQYYNYLIHPSQSINKITNYDRIDDIINATDLIEDKYRNNPEIRKAVNSFYFKRFVNVFKILEVNIIKGDVREEYIEKINKAWKEQSNSLDIIKKIKILIWKIRIFITKRNPKFIKNIEEMKEKIFSKKMKRANG